MQSHMTFSQSSLQDYVDCARRFQLRYVERVRWPTVRDERAGEWEQHARQGAVFHRLVQQSEAGIPRVQLTPVARAEGILPWWQRYVDTPPTDLPAGLRRVESAFVAPIAGHRLLARYDLLAIDPGRRAVIVDWKTGERRQSRTLLERRMQTVVYRYVLAEAGASVTGGEPIAPRQIALVYWFASGQPAEHLTYGAQAHAVAGKRLRSLVQEIDAMGAGDWPLASDERRCTYCPYRTLCGREGAQGGELPDWEADEDEVNVDLEQIAEIEF